jgi:hypothetical protein
MEERFPRIIKSHGPAMGKADTRRSLGVLRSVRHPLANYNAWRRRQKLASARDFDVIAFKKYVKRWTNHHLFWKQYCRRNRIPSFVYLYEDLFHDPAFVLDKLLTFTHQKAYFNLTTVRIEHLLRTVRKAAPRVDDAKVFLFEGLPKSFAEHLLSDADARAALHRYGYYLSTKTFIAAWSRLEDERAKS